MNEICNFKVRAQQNNTICVSHLAHEYQWTSISCSPSTTVAWKNESVTENRCETLHLSQGMIEHHITTWISIYGCLQTSENMIWYQQIGTLWCNLTKKCLVDQSIDLYVLAVAPLAKWFTFCASWVHSYKR